MEWPIAILLTILFGWPYWYFGFTGMIFTSAVYGLALLIILRHYGIKARKLRKTRQPAAAAVESTEIEDIDLTMAYGYDRLSAN